MSESPYSVGGVLPKFQRPELRPLALTLWGIGTFLLMPALLFSGLIWLGSLGDLFRALHTLTPRQAWLLGMSASVLICWLTSLGAWHPVWRCAVIVNVPITLGCTVAADVYDRAAVAGLEGGCGLSAIAAMVLRVVLYSVYAGMPLVGLSALIGIKQVSTLHYQRFLS